MPATQKTLLECKGIVKAFGRTNVIDGLSLEVRRGETLGLVGKSGGGKSTLLKCLIGYYTVDAGSIVLEGEEISKSLNTLRKRFGYTTQENSFYEKLTVLENVRYYARLYGVDKRLRSALHAHIDSILASVGLSEHKRKLAERLSGGQKRRLDFAICLLHDPEVLVLDEPTTGLDPILIRQFWDVVAGVKKRGKTIIVSSHILSELEENCDRIVIMDKGKISKILGPKEFQDGKLTRNIKKLIGS